MASSALSLDSLTGSQLSSKGHEASPAQLKPVHLLPLHFDWQIEAGFFRRTASVWKHFLMHGVCRGCLRTGRLMWGCRDGSSIHLICIHHRHDGAKPNFYLISCIETKPALVSALLYFRAFSCRDLGMCHPCECGISVSMAGGQSDQNSHPHSNLSLLNFN